MPYATPADAINARLRASAPLGALVSGRINPQFGTQEPVIPLVRFAWVQSDSVYVLSGQNSGRVMGQTIEVDAIGRTEAEARSVGLAVAAALCPDTPWQDKANGVHGCFPSDVTQGVTEDGFRVYGQVFRLFFAG